MKINLSELSSLTGLDRRTISQRLQPLEPEITGRSHNYESKSALPLLYGWVDSKGDFDLTEERARLAHHQANIAAITEKQTTGKLVPYRWHLNAVTIIATILHSRLSKLSYRVIALTPGDWTEAAKKELGAGVMEVRRDLGDAVQEAMNAHIDTLPEEHRNA